MKLFISTYPFGREDSTPILMLKESGIQFSQNNLKRKLKPEETLKFAIDCDILIAGTENLEPIITNSSKLKFISRVGIGLDSVPLELCKEKGIRVSYTPDAVTKAVSELTIGLMIDATRGISFCDREIRRSEWSRPVGKRLEESRIGILGFGRVGKSVTRLLRSFQPKEILVCDIRDITEEIKEFSDLSIRIVSFDDIVSLSDIISIHVPLTKITKGIFDFEVMKKMKSDNTIINTSRGEVIHEEALYEILKKNSTRTAAVDVFQNEPYSGKLIELENCILTEHIGSCSLDARLRMESEAAEEAVRFFNGEQLLQEVVIE
ncbi:MAG: NAD(P)-dependent oxidoreductase [Leptospiraceae bacterium]|nr:NAD(P)-dependent oxidoreductase [Leptospiraceae bacterium]